MPAAGLVAQQRHGQHAEFARHGGGISGSEQPWRGPVEQPRLQPACASVTVDVENDPAVDHPEPGPPQRPQPVMPDVRSQVSPALLPPSRGLARCRRRRARRRRPRRAARSPAARWSVGPAAAAAGRGGRTHGRAARATSGPAALSAASAGIPSHARRSARRRPSTMDCSRARRSAGGSVASRIFHRSGLLFSRTR